MKRTKTLRFHLDEYVNGAVEYALRKHGLDITTTHGTELHASADPTQLEFAASRNRVLVTYDRDFLRLHKAGVSHTGIAYCDQGRRTRREIIRRLVALSGQYAPEEMANRIVYL